jgi:hypothetical protein
MLARALRQIGPAKCQIVEIAVVQLAKLAQGLPIAELLAGPGPSLACEPDERMDGHLIVPSVLCGYAAIWLDCLGKRPGSAATARGMRASPWPIVRKSLSISSARLRLPSLMKTRDVAGILRRRRPEWFARASRAALAAGSGHRRERQAMGVAAESVGLHAPPRLLVGGPHDVGTGEAQIAELAILLLRMVGVVAGNLLATGTASRQSRLGPCARPSR